MMNIFCFLQLVFQIQVLWPRLKYSKLKAKRYKIKQKCLETKETSLINKCTITTTKLNKKWMSVPPIACLMLVKSQSPILRQRDQLQNMERRVALSIREADTAEAKLELMEGVIDKLKVCNSETALKFQSDGANIFP